MGNPVYAREEGCSPQATLVYEGTNSKYKPENLLKVNVT
jgi:hypothetical protein